MNLQQTPSVSCDAPNVTLKECSELGKLRESGNGGRGVDEGLGEGEGGGGASNLWEASGWVPTYGLETANCEKQLIVKSKPFYQDQI